MSDINELVARIDGAFAAVREKVREQQKKELKHLQEQQKRFEDYTKTQAKIVEIAKPRLEALANRAGTRVSITPSVTATRRAVRFEFKSAKAHIALTFSVAPDREINNVVVGCDLQIVPVLWRFDSHAEFSTPVTSPDYPGLIRWLDDRIVNFVELYIQIHEGELYDNAEYVEDPVAGVKFPKFAAGATIEHAGKTHYFIDDNMRAEFAKQKGLVTT